MEFIDTDLENFTSLLNKICLEKQKEEKEIVDTDTKNLAALIVNTTSPETTYDVLKYCSALNVLNTFVKQPNVDKDYSFKRNITFTLIPAIIKNEINGIIYFFDNQKNNSIFYIKIYNIMFSFHKVNIKEGSYIINSELNKEIEFDNIRKQQCSVSILKSVIEWGEKDDRIQKIK